MTGFLSGFLLGALRCLVLELGKLKCAGVHAVAHTIWRASLRSEPSSHSLFSLFQTFPAQLAQNSTQLASHILTSRAWLQVLKCYQGKWFASPACRAQPENCTALQLGSSEFVVQGLSGLRIS